MAQEIISEITLNVSEATSTFTSIQAKQGDNKSRVVIAKIMNGSKPLVIDSTDTLFVNFKRTADQKSKAYSAKLTDDGRVKFEIPFWVLEFAYTVKCDISIVGVADESGDCPKLTTLDFFIEVEPAALSDADVQADDSTSYLLTLIEETKVLAKDFRGYFVTDSETTDIDITIADRTQYCFNNPSGISSCKITIPTSAQHGWCSECTFKVGATADVTVEIVNYSSFAKSVVAVVPLDASESYVAPAGKTIVILIAVTGLNALCTIREL